MARVQGITNFSQRGELEPGSVMSAAEEGFGLWEQPWTESEDLEVYEQLEEYAVLHTLAVAGCKSPSPLFDHPLSAGGGSAMMKRGDIRAKFGIEGDRIGDCCAAYWCACCT